jgi:uncharacterized membrane protein
MARDDRVLEKHLRHWRGRGLVTPELEARLREASAELAPPEAGVVVRGALALLGGGLLLAGLALIVAEHWAAIPRYGKLGGWAAIQILLLLAADALGRRFADRRYLAQALTLASCGWAFAGIGLVSEIYHVASRDPNGFWLWLALLLPAAFVLERPAVSASAFVALLLALAAEAASRDSWVRCSQCEGPWLVLALPLLAAGLATLLPGGLLWLRGWLGGWLVVAGAFLLLVLGTDQHMDRSDLGRAWLLAGPGLLVGLAWPRRVLPESWDAGTARGVILLTLLPWALLGARYDAGRPLDEAAIVVAWLAQLAVAVLVIRAGARAASPAFVNLGYLALLAGIVSRYFDFFGKNLEGGLALALSGALLLFVLFALEKARRRTLGKGGAS